MASFWHRFLDFFRKGRKAKNALKTNTFSMILLPQAPHFGIQIQAKMHTIFDVVFWCNFFQLFGQLDAKSAILGPLWRPAGSQMAPKIGQMAPKWLSKNSGAAPKRNLRNRLRAKRLPWRPFGDFLARLAPFWVLFCSLGLTFPALWRFFASILRPFLQKSIQQEQITSETCAEGKRKKQHRQ